MLDVLVVVVIDVDVDVDVDVDLVDVDVDVVAVVVIPPFVVVLPLCSTSSFNDVLIIRSSYNTLLKMHSVRFCFILL